MESGNLLISEWGAGSYESRMGAVLRAAGATFEEGRGDRGIYKVGAGLLSIPNALSRELFQAYRDLVERTARESARGGSVVISAPENSGEGGAMAKEEIGQRKAAILAFLAGGKRKPKEIVEHVGGNKATVGFALKQLAREGRVSHEGKTTAALWFLKDGGAPPQPEKPAKKKARQKAPRAKAAPAAPQTLTDDEILLRAARVIQSRIDRDIELVNSLYRQAGKEPCYQVEG